MKSFTLNNPVKIVFGSGTFENAGAEARLIGKRALIVTGKSSAKRTGMIGALQKNLLASGVDSTVYSYITPNPKVHEVDEASELAREDNCDIIIGFGGGSAMDAAKGVAVTAANGGSVWDYVGTAGKPPSPADKALPVMLIPTLAATGSEGNPAAVFTNTELNQKSAIYNPSLCFPKVSIVDPKLTLSVPAKQTAEGIIDIIMHVLEEYLTGDPSCDLQDRFTEGIILTCIENTPRVLKNPNDLTARENISLASTIALQGVPNAGRAGAWIVHPLEHAISAIYDCVAHGSGIASLLPTYLEMLAGTQYEARAKKLGERIFGKASTTAAAEGFRNFIRSAGLAENMKTLGIDKDMIEKIADTALETSGNVFGLDRAGLIAFYTKAYGK